jgi:hypothetical protein
LSENSITLLKEIDSPIDKTDAASQQFEKDSFFSILKKNMGIR